MGFYAESYDRPNQSGIAQEDIHVGTIVVMTSAGQVHNTDDTDTAADGVALAPRRGDYIAKEPDEETTFEYLAAEDDRVPFADFDEAGARFKARTISDNSTDPAASISDGDVVGVAHKADDAFRGRLVQEGYTDNAGTQYGDGGAGGFTAVGTVYRDDASDFDEAVRFIVDN
jgi:hypothetical protein